MSFPTQITILRIVLVPVFYVLFAVVEPQQTFWAGLVFLVAALSDWYDGYFARILNSATPLGAFLDPLADKLLSGAALIAFAVTGIIPLWMALLIIVRDIYLTLFRIFGENADMPVRTSYFARVKTFLQFVFFALVLIGLAAAQWEGHPNFQALGQAMIAPTLIYWSLAALTIVTVWSAVQYTIDNWALVAYVVRRFMVGGSPQKL